MFANSPLNKNKEISLFNTHLSLSRAVGRQSKKKY